MDKFLLISFWVSVSIVAYTYVGYGAVIYVFSKFRKAIKFTENDDNGLPEVTLLIAAYNEERFIDEKIRNTSELDYPKEKLQVFIVTDGSTDATPEIVSRYPDIRHFHEPGRKGKIHAVNRVMKYVNTPVTVFCDANTYLNAGAIRKLVRHYQDEKTGGVAGEKRILKKDEDNASGAGEGMYWKYESFLKKKDAEVYSIVGAAGELFSIRTKLYEPPDENMIIEDFYLSMRIVSKGYRFAYEPEAFASETASVSVEEEWKRKVRICAGAFQAMKKLTYLLNPFRYGILTFQYISHRVLRWTLAPLALPIAFVSNFGLALGNNAVYKLILALHVSFYGLAFAGYLFRDKTIKIKGFFVPYYFAVMNAAVYAGLIRYLRGRQSVVWERAKRAEATPKGF
jgi:cellulose synthase/poly-beta-1,6-N-acetylglucosamine synthase-like glycosyltransferase